MQNTSFSLNRFGCEKKCKYRNPTQKHGGATWNRKRFFHFWFHEELFQEMVLQKTFKGVSRNGSLRHYSWFHQEPFNPGFFKEPFP